MFLIAPDIYYSSKYQTLMSNLFTIYNENGEKCCSCGNYMVSIIKNLFTRTSEIDNLPLDDIVFDIDLTENQQFMLRVPMSAITEAQKVKQPGTQKCHSCLKCINDVSEQQHTIEPTIDTIKLTNYYTKVIQFGNDHKLVDHNLSDTLVQNLTTLRSLLPDYMF